jgi:hypothetical protein
MEMTTSPIAQSRQAREVLAFGERKGQNIGGGLPGVLSVEETNLLIVGDDHSHLTDTYLLHLKGDSGDSGQPVGAHLPAEAGGDGDEDVVV